MSDRCFLVVSHTARAEAIEATVHVVAKLREAGVVPVMSAGDRREFAPHLDLSLTDELDSEIRERPRRRRRKINLADFLKAAGGEGNPARTSSEVTNAYDAYQLLGLEFGTPLADVTTAFRQRAKELHPDARNGDRSSEPELRRILEAYQFLKEYLSLSNTEPPISRGAEYRPTE